MSLPGTFRVDIEELGRISQRLDEGITGMHTAMQKMNQATADQLGHESLDSACADFQSKWNYGIGQIAKLATSIRGSIDATAHSYRTCEMGIQQALSKGTESGSVASSRASSSKSSAFG